jgi:putative transposase
MAKERVELLEWLRKVVSEGDKDFLRDGMRMLVQTLMELEVEALTGAEYRERTAERLTSRNGYRDRLWDTQVGALDLRIPKLRTGSYLPSLLDARRRVDQALVSVIQEAYVHGVSTRKVDDLVKALGMTGISASSVSRLCGDLDEAVQAFLTRPMTGSYVYVWLDATFLKARGGSVGVNKAAVVAVGVTDTGQREVLGMAIGPAESEEFWHGFLRSLVERGLTGVRLVISDAHKGLKKAIAAILGGAAWQRCRVHFMRNVLCSVPREMQPMVSAVVRTIFAQPDKAAAHAALARAVDTLRKRFPKVANLLLEAEEDVLAYMAFPSEHWRKIHSTNPLERLNKEIKRRTDVVGIFPSDPSALRLVGAVLMEQHDDWSVGRRYLSEESLKKLAPPLLASPTPELEAVA